jgi:propanol-preferring alcohol dehydrogenase
VQLCSLGCVTNVRVLYAAFMCAGTTVYKGIKESEARPGQFITIVGAAGGLGHLAIQYAKAMGLRVIAVDKGPEKKKLCDELGAELSIDVDGIGGNKKMVAAVLAHTEGMGSHAILLTATHTDVFSEVLPMTRRMGFIVVVGVDKNDLKLPIPDLALRRITIRGTCLGTRQDMYEALDFAKRGLVKCHVETRPFEQLNDVYKQLIDGNVEGRVVMMMDTSSTEVKAQSNDDAENDEQGDQNDAEEGEEKSGGKKKGSKSLGKRKSGAKADA